MTYITSFFTGPDGVVLVRLLVGAGLGAVIGFERERSAKAAGLRTHALVGLGSALFTAISILAFASFPSVNGVAGYDYHLVANIVVGIGFLGGGAILRHGDRVKGLTTAASLWITAAIGMAAGFGFFKQAVAATVMVYAILTLLWLVEKRFREKMHYKPEAPHRPFDAQKSHELPQGE